MASPVALRRTRLGPAAALVGSLGFAALVGLAASVAPLAGVVLVAAAVGAVVIARDPTILPLLLVFTMFVESLSLGSSLRVGRIAGAVAMVVICYSLLERGRDGLRTNALVLAIAAWGLWALASTYWADFDGLVVTTLSSYVLGIAYTFALALLVRKPSQMRRLYGVLVGGSLVFGLISFLQYAGSSSGTTRAAGLQGDPNYFAVYQVIALAPTLTLAAFERRALRRLVLYGSVGVIVLSVVSSLSRTGIVALVLVVAATLVLPSRLFFAHAGRKLGYVAALLVASAAAVAVGSTALVARVQSIFATGSATGDRGAGRTDLWSAAWHGYTEHPWLGLGAGNFTGHALDLLQTTPGVDTTRNYITTANVVHNGYLEQLTELGPLGLALWLSILVLSARYLVRAARRGRASGNLEHERLAAAAGVSLLGYATSVIFLSNELGKPLWIFAGLALALDVTTRKSLAPASDLPARDPVEARELRLERELRSLALERERLDRRRAALAEHEPTLTAGPESRAEAAERLDARLAEVEKALAALDARVAELQGEPAAVGEARGRLGSERPEAAGATPPPGEADASAAPVGAGGRGPLVLRLPTGRWHLAAIEALAAQHPDHARFEEWQTYLAFLRQHVDAAGGLPEQYGPLVDEVFGELVTRA